MFRPALTRRAQRQQIARAQSVPSPVGGWNARDPLGSMDPSDAVILDNWFPKPSYCQLRSGFTNWATGIPGTVETLMGYNAPSSNALFAVSNNSGACAVYNVTTQGAVGAAVLSGLTNARWQHVNFTTPGGAFLFMVNGADSARHWNGATWATPAITVGTSSTFVDVAVHKARLWFVQANSLSLWYLPVQSVAGAAVEFPLGSVFRGGGSLAAVSTWTLDAGYGVDDHLVAITTEGEVAVYRGTDPSSATTWALVGVWQIGAPLGRRCLTKFAGDLLVVCKDGLLPMSEALQSTRVNNRISLTDKIQNAVSEATTLYGANFGWEVELYPPENMLFLNVPISATASEQYVMNTISRSWCRFTGMSANCWELFSDRVFFGTAGKVCRAWDGTSDAGAAIVADALAAFNYFGARTQLKKWSFARPIFSVDNSPGVLLSLAVDFEQTAPAGVPTFSAPTSAVWDSAIWDLGLWGGSGAIRKDWQSVSGLGYCAAVRLKTASTVSDVQWASTDYVMEAGGVL